MRTEAAAASSTGVSLGSDPVASRSTAEIASLRRRLSPPGLHHDDEPSDSTAPLARTAFWLLATGATATLVSLLFDVSASRNDLGVAAVAVTAYPLAALCVLRYEHLTLRDLQLISAASIVLVTLGLIFGGSDSGYYRMFYVWIALFSSYHFSRKGAALQIVGMAVGYGVLISVVHIAAAPIAWLLTVATLIVIGGITSTLRGVVNAQLRETQIQNQRLIEADRLKDQFLATVSHELRTPLTSIRGYLELLREDNAGNLSSQQRTFIDVVDRNSDRLLSQVSDLLLVAQIEAGAISVDRTPLDVIATVEAAVDRHASTASTRGIALTVETLPAPTILGDASRLGRALDMLLSNALKFTPEGGRTWVRVRPLAHAVEIEVSDTGPGIPPTDHDRIFERFFRSEGVTDRAVPGTGIGLTIARGIVAAHGGRLTCTSVVGTGSTFTVTLPDGTGA